MVSRLVDVDDVEVETVPLPGSEPHVEVRRLHTDDDGRPTSLVRFPSGWARPVTGAYEVVEEVLWLEGGFTMSGHHHPPGTYTWLPAWYVRRESSAPDGALAFAWFGGRPGWHTDDLREPEAEPVITHWRDAPIQPSPLGVGGAYMLNVEAGGHATWMLEDVEAGRPATLAAQLYSLPERRFCAVGARQPLPELEGPVYCRTFPS